MRRRLRGDGAGGGGATALGGGATGREVAGPRQCLGEERWGGARGDGEEAGVSHEAIPPIKAA